MTAPAQPSQRVAIYARVSTDDQVLEGQLRDLESYVGEWVPGPASVTVYREKVSARGKVERSECDWLLRDTRVGEIQDVCAHCYADKPVSDRMGREFAEARRSTTPRGDVNEAVPTPPTFGTEPRGALSEPAPAANTTATDTPLSHESRNRCAVYLRVSTEDQDLAGQERDLRGEAERRRWTVAKVYAEKVSGTGKVERREYDRLIAEANLRGRPFDHLLVWALDRFSREATFTKATQAVLDLEKLGISFHSLKEPTLDTPEDGRANLGRDVLLALLPVIASFESQRRSERVRVAMREIKEGRRRTRSGRPPGRPRRVTPEVISRVQELRSRGFEWKVIAQYVGLPAGTCRKVRIPLAL